MTGRLSILLDNYNVWLRTKFLSLPGIARIAIVVIIFVSSSIIAGLLLPEGIDWTHTYRPAALAVLSGKSPFTVDIFFSAPWAVLPLIPFAILPEQIGRGFIFVIGILVFAYTAIRLGAKPIALTAFLLSPPIWHCLLNSNIEWMPLVAYVLPPKFGLFLIPIKPQIGIGAAIFWLSEAWRNRNIREFIGDFAPATLLLGLSFVVFGVWPLRFTDTLALTQEYNQSLWPMSIPVGLGLLAYAIRKQSIRHAMAASPCLSPYVLLHAWSGALAAVLTDDFVTVCSVLGLWILMAIRWLNG